MDRYSCPCCGQLTLDEKPPGTWLVCEVCWWEDDPVQFAHPDLPGGANRPSLNEARTHFKNIGVSAPEDLERIKRNNPRRLPK